MSAPKDLGLADDADYFCWLLDRAIPWPHGCAVVLEAYIDASKRDDGTFCVAGFAFGADRAKKAVHNWRELWGETRCHMTDLHSRKRGSPFERWTAEQAGQRLKESVPIILGAASFAVAVSVSLSEIKKLAPKSADKHSTVIFGGFRSAYAVCCHAAMGSLARLVSAETEIAYFFESGDEFQSDSQQFMAWVATTPMSRSFYKLRSHTVLKKEDCRLFEMSDIFAWEWAKHVERTGGGLPMRPSLLALLGECRGSNQDATNVISSTRRGWHLTGMPLERYFARAEELGLFKDGPANDALEALLATGRLSEIRTRAS